MSEVKHTMGPWVVCGDGLKIKPHPKDMFFAPIAEAFPVVEWSKEEGNWDKTKLVEARYNAKLIASAPDLLKALEEEELALEEDLRWAEGLKEYEGLSLRLERVRAAIRSAKGE